jgi:HSP20 family protein
MQQFTIIKQEVSMPDKQSDIARRDEQQLRRRQAPATPFRMLERFADEMDRMFDELGFGHAFSRRSEIDENFMWAPRIDVTQRNNELVIRADLPGLKKDDVKVDVTDDAVTIQGERHRERDDEQGGIYRSERSYGSFYRAIPLPEGAMADQAKASFNNGVLEITMPAPPEQVSKGRRLEINEGTGKTK